VALPRVVGQHVVAEDGDVYVVVGAPARGPWRPGALAAFVGDGAGLGWSWAWRRPVVDVLFGGHDGRCGDGVVDPGEACDGGGAGGKFDDGVACVRCAVPGAGLFSRLDVAVAGALVEQGRIGNTLWLTLPALVAALVGALVLGAWGARAGGRVDAAVRAFAVVGSSAPTFVVALGLIALVAVRARLLPTGGMLSPGVFTDGAGPVVLDRLRHAALPWAVLTFAWTAHLVRAVRSAVLDVVEAPFVRAARARGLSERTLLVRHILPNAAVPLVTLAGLSLPSLLGGALLTETVFAWPGLGRLQYDALLQHDAAVVVTTSVLIAALVVVGSLAADVAAWLLDPRLRAASAPALARRRAWWRRARRPS
jgi:peptide/nickel transport system permease protein